MSHTLSSTPSSRTFADVAGRLVAASNPQRPRGPDRRVRRGCIDEKDAAAQPWDRNRFGSVHERIATSEALIAIAKELQAEGAARFPRGRVLELAQQRAVLAAELDELMRAEPADRPIGRPAALRIEVDAIDAQLEEHSLSITRADVDVYEAFFGFLCFAGSGRWFPSWEKVAEAARCCTKTVGRALRRLKHHGLLAWVSRSRMEAGKGQAKAHRGQTSHAYFLDLRKRMAERVYQRFLQLRARRHKRMVARSAAPPVTAPPPPPPPTDRHVAATRAAVASLGASLSLREGQPGSV